MNQLVILGTGIMFLTRLPVGKYASGDSHALVQAVRFFPLIGVIVALIMGCVLMLSNLLLPLSVSVVLALFAGVMATGAFHEDGLADLADSAGAFEVSRKLDIMRDSRVGTYGSLALVLCLALRFALIFELATYGTSVVLAALILAHSSGRWSSAFLMANVDYARSEAGNKVVAQGVNNTILLQSTLCLLLVMLVPAVVISLWIYAALAVVWLVSIASAHYFRSTFNGITGDCLGAANVITELMSMMFVLACLRLFA
ncbi:MAG: adenosylcobinamide-GDP ribazoletransferase [Granulosicoccus sp.]